MQRRYCDEYSVRLSVCPSLCHTRVLWQNGRKICPDLYTIRKNIYPSFLRRSMVGGGQPLLPEIIGQPREIWTISCDNSETVLLITNRKSHTGFPLVPTAMTLNDLERRNGPYFAFFHGIRQIFRPIISQLLKIDLYCP